MRCATESDARVAEIRIEYQYRLVQAWQEGRDKMAKAVRDFAFAYDGHEIEISDATGYADIWLAEKEKS